ncbi:unnamed protein product [Amoebophrya sp. A120]|nr:unnamed protein product [Amoebophrya sp. A120]|eukprot:GSA120T00016703001.1
MGQKNSRQETIAQIEQCRLLRELATWALTEDYHVLQPSSSTSTKKSSPSASAVAASSRAPRSESEKGIASSTSTTTAIALGEADPEAVARCIRKLGRSCHAAAERHVEERKKLEEVDGQHSSSSERNFGGGRGRADNLYPAGSYAPSSATASVREPAESAFRSSTSSRHDHQREDNEEDLEELILNTREVFASSTPQQSSAGDHARKTEELVERYGQLILDLSPPDMKAVRFRLVPQRMKEALFWRCYFHLLRNRLNTHADAIFLSIPAAGEQEYVHGYAGARAPAASSVENAPARKNSAPNKIESTLRPPISADSWGSGIGGNVNNVVELQTVVGKARILS